MTMEKTGYDGHTLGESQCKLQFIFTQEKNSKAETLRVLEEEIQGKMLMNFKQDTGSTNH